MTTLGPGDFLDPWPPLTINPDYKLYEVRKLSAQNCMYSPNDLYYII